MQSLNCPNPHCMVTSFNSDEAICHHLGDSSTGCSEWAEAYIRHMLEHMDFSGDDEELNEVPDNHGTNSNIYDNDIIIDQHLDEDIPPSAPFDDSELPGDLVSSDSWSPPMPSSMLFSPESSQTLPPVDQQSAASDVPVVSLAGLHKEFHPSPSLWVPGGQNLLQ